MSITRVEYEPGSARYQKKLRAGTTFSFPYPNGYGEARGMFTERTTRTRIRFEDSDVYLDGVVTAIDNEPEATIECADPISLLGDLKVTPELLNTLASRDCARVIADLLIMIGDECGLDIEERIVGTDPFVPLPRDFIEEKTDGADLVKKLMEHIETETRKLTEEPVEYFFGFIGGRFRFERVLPVEDECTTLEVTKDMNLYEERPEFHYDRLVNRARAIGRDGLIGPLYEDEQSIGVFGIKEPEDDIEMDTDNKMDLYIAARNAVEKGKVLTVSRKITIPDAHFLTPGIHTIDVVESVYGAPGKSRVVQVEGSSGEGGQVVVTLETIPLDDLEVISKIIRRLRS